ncbi:MAG: hypothetical protein ACRDP1_17190 [Nocardioidaceae bacterium]
MAEHGDLERELRAGIEARKELGPEYEPALVESFMDKIDAAVRHRVDSEVRWRQKSRSSWDPHTFAMGTLGLAIPITAIAGGIAGLAGMGVAWLGIVGVNVAASIGSVQQRRARDRP